MSSVQLNARETKGKVRSGALRLQGYSCSISRGGGY